MGGAVAVLLGRHLAVQGAGTAAHPARGARTPPRLCPPTRPHLGQATAGRPAVGQWEGANATVQGVGGGAGR